MKRTVLFIISLIIIPASMLMAQDVNRTEAADSSAPLTVGPKASWDKTIYRMGELKYKVPKEAEFTLTNAGNVPLLITYARASCGCTDLQYSEAPVLPGKSTKVKVTYDATGIGDFLKTITVVTNGDEQPTTLQITGKVVNE